MCQADDENNADELIYDEFEECLARVSLELFPVQDTEASDELMTSIKQFMEDWVPVALKAKAHVK